MKGRTRKQARIDNANARKAKRDRLTPREQMSKLDRRLGIGKGATKERARLCSIIAAEEPTA